MIGRSRIAQSLDRAGRGLDVVCILTCVNLLSTGIPLNVVVES